MLYQLAQGCCSQTRIRTDARMSVLGLMADYPAWCWRSAARIRADARMSVLWPMADYPARCWRSAARVRLMP